MFLLCVNERLKLHSEQLIISRKINSTFFLKTHNIYKVGMSSPDVAGIPGLHHRIGLDEREQSSLAGGP